MTTAPVISLVDRLPDAVESKEIIEMLEVYLKSAKAGEIRSLALVAIMSDGQALTATTRPKLNLLGALSHLVWRAHAEVQSDSEDIGGAA